MSNLHFDFEWQDPAGARGEELRATWASLSILIDGSPVTELQDKQTKAVRHRVFLPLFPLAEWLADNWWFLRSEIERPDAAASCEFDRRHNIRWAREGYVLPSLRFVRLGSNVEARWQPLDIADARIRFLASGDAILPDIAFFQTLHEFVSAVVTRLDDMGVPGTTLHEQWRAIQEADPDEREFCDAAARLGKDPYAADSQLEAAILDVSRMIRPELLDDFLSLTAVEHLRTQASALATASESIASDADNIDALAAVRSRAPSWVLGTASWETGYRFASALRARLNGSGWKSHSLDELAGYLSIDQLGHCLLPETGECGFLDALTGSNQRRNPKFLIEKRREDSRQFAFCRALFEHLTLPRDSFAAVSRLRTDRQQMNRAFAAEFLAPHEMLKSDLSGAVIGEDEIDDLAVAYGVSAFVVRHQIENHRLARVSS
ncbi:MAG: hypothetical protein GXY58_06260 [Planctomycetaceae bacterium]|nr:hypothetical protein [Planctomycetaceae bacterium]